MLPNKTLTSDVFRQFPAFSGGGHHRVTDPGSYAAVPFRVADGQELIANSSYAAVAHCPTNNQELTTDNVPHTGFYRHLPLPHPRTRPPFSPFQ